jgi:hypothetical protein
MILEPVDGLDCSLGAAHFVIEYALHVLPPGGTKLNKSDQTGTTIQLIYRL